MFGCGTSSISNTYGNIAALIQEHVESKFPNNFFKYKHMSTTFGFRFMKYRSKELEDSIYKREKPLLLIRPIFEVPGNDDYFLQGTRITGIQEDNLFNISRGSLKPCLVDRDEGYELAYQMNRDRISFDVTVRVNTLLMQLDVYKNMQNMIPWNSPYFLDTSLESLIPRSIVSYIGKLKGMNIDKNETSVSVLLEYLQKMSRYPITYKIKNSSSTDEFFLYYNQRVLLTFSDLSLNEGNRKNMVEDDFEVTFRVSAEFNLPGLYALLGRDDKNFKRLDFTLEVVSPNDNKEFIPIFTLNKLFEDEFQYKDGYRLFTTSIIKTDEEQINKDDTLDIKPLFTEDIIAIIKQYNFSTMMEDILFRVQLLKNNVKLEFHKDYDVDWNRMELTIHNSQPSETYRLIIYGNMVLINQKLYDMQRTNDLTYNDISSEEKVNDELFEVANNYTFRTNDNCIFTPNDDKGDI